MSRTAKRIFGFLTVVIFLNVFSSGRIDAQINSASNLSGTFQIDSSRSENVRNIVENAARNNRISAVQKEDLAEKLEAPASISIDIRGSRVTISTSETSPVTITADGRTQNAGAARVRATLPRGGDELRISSVGGNTDYLVTFTAVDAGRSLRVTRMVTTDYLRQTVYADSFYNRTGSGSIYNDSTGSNDDYSSSDPNDDGYTTTNDSGYPSSGRNNPNNTQNYPRTGGNYPRTTNRTGNFYVPYGMVLTGILENRITTGASQENDRFRLIVDYPNEFRGAVVEGYLTGVQRSGKISGSSKLTFNFETIRLRSGRTYDFAGVLQNVTDPQGREININNEGQVKGESRTKETVKRGGIGAGLGAIIGGILGGGKGAVIGATIGGSAGAGSVILDGKDDVDLEPGTKINVQSTSPNR